MAIGKNKGFKNTKSSSKEAIEKATDLLQRNAQVKDVCYRTGLSRSTIQRLKRGLVGAEENSYIHHTVR